MLSERNQDQEVRMSATGKRTEIEMIVTGGRTRGGERREGRGGGLRRGERGGGVKRGARLGGAGTSNRGKGELGTQETPEIIFNIFIICAVDLIILNTL